MEYVRSTEKKKGRVLLVFLSISQQDIITMVKTERETGIKQMCVGSYPEPVRRKRLKIASLYNFAKAMVPISYELSVIAHRCIYNTSEIF